MGKALRICYPYNRRTTNDLALYAGRGVSFDQRQTSMDVAVTSRLHIYTQNLTDILLLFDGESAINNIVLGDTCHPQSGYVTEELISDIKTVSGLFEFNYDFPCLVEFSALIAAVRVELVDEPKGNTKYIVTGSATSIRTIKDAMSEKNSVHPKLYQYEVEW